MQERQGFLQKHAFVVVFFTVLFIFLLSANRAWVTHRVIDGQYWVLNYPPSMPFMWQYDLDANAHLSSTAFFPDYYKVEPAFTDRPMMHGAGWLIGRAASLIVNPILRIESLKPIVTEGITIIQKKSALSELYGHKTIDSETATDYLGQYFSAAAGLIIFKFIAFFSAGIMMFQLVKRYSDAGIALFSVVLLFFSGYMINAIGTYHTYEFQILSPIIVLYLFHQLCRKYSAFRNIIFSLIIGLLFMVKANYPVYLAALLYALFFFKNRRLIYSAVAISVLAHSIPWLLWHTYLEVTGKGLFGIYSDINLVGKAYPQHPYSLILNDYLMATDTPKAEQLRPGLPAWGDRPNLFQRSAYDYSLGGIAVLAKLVITKFLATLSVYATPTGFFAAVGTFILWREKQKRLVIWILLLLFLVTLIQVTAIFPTTFRPRLVFDPSFIVYAIACFALFQLLSSFAVKTRTVILTTILLTSLTITVLTNIKLPWVHPMDQTGHFSSIVTSPKT